MKKLLSMKDILIIEPFYGGSHAQLVDLLCSDDEIRSRVQLYVLSAKKWHWRARTSALYLSQEILPSSHFRLLFCSSVLNLAELVSLRPDLARLRKVVYFHENQLIYPVQKQQDRDFHYGYSQILTTMVADEVIFNSQYNMESFLDSISRHLKLIPDHRPKRLAEQIRPKCRVIYFPLKLIEDGAKGSCIDENPQVLDSIEKEQTRQSHTLEMKQNDSVIHASCDGLQLAQMDASKSCKFPMSSSNESVMCSYKNDSSDVNKSVDLLSKQTEPNVLISNLNGDGEEFPMRIDNEQASHKECDFVGSFAKAGDSGGLPVDSDSVKVTCKRSKVDQNVVPNTDLTLHIVWPHRWEHDKGPLAFFDALFQLQEDGFNFKVSVIGETYSQIPDVFHEAHSRLGPRINAWGYQSREDYLNILKSGHVVVSTADHEFFGVSMLEATCHGCFPLCPKRLVYPEIYPDECLYSTQAQLIKRLKQFCRRPDKIRSPSNKISMTRFSWERLKEDYRNLLLKST